MNVRVLITVVILLAASSAPCFAQFDWCWDMDYFRATAAGGTIHIVHENAFYNCCQDYFDFNIVQDGFNVRIEETEVNPQCMCFCCFDIPVDVGPVGPGLYHVEFFWRDMEHGPQHAHFDVDVPDGGPLPDPLREDIQVPPPPCQPNPPADVDATPQAPGGLMLRSGYPNPARGQVTLVYEVAREGRVRVEVFGAGGQRVRSLIDSEVSPGSHMAIWDGKDDAGQRVAAGAYYCRLITTGGSAERRVIIVR
jgi:hypothetical protein